ncbi:Helicase associated domain protein [Streptomyces sp. NPDC018019]|uniref:DEAD/DEAH box helicase n=1 Tax=Streptomyces sp. NPDC018019 TaxID=3365030 RepID=UPI0037BDDDBF
MASASHLPAPALWPHQREAVTTVTDTLSRTERTTAVMACGTGKTRVGIEIAQNIAPTGRVLTVVPSIELVGQTLHAYRQTYGDGAGRTVALCSDPGVMDRRGQDLRAEHAAVTTSPAELARLTAGPGRVTVVSTYAGMRVLQEAHASHALSPWTLGIVDEAHRTAGAAGKAWAQVHDDVALPADRRLYLTATPRIVGSRGGFGLDDFAVSMDNPKIYGPRSYTLSFARASALGLLAKYQVVVAVVTNDEVRALAAEQRHYQVGRSAVSVDMLARQIAVLRAAEQHGIRRLITYHGRVSDADWFAKTLPAMAPLLAADGAAAPSVWAGHVRGAQSVADRRKVLDRLRGNEEGLVVVSNARVLTEGVDAPAVDGIAFIDPRESTIDIIQALGRAMRLGDRKDKVASIIVPVLLGPDEDPVQALESSAYHQVWRIARALRAHDEALGEQLDKARLQLGAGAGHERWPANPVTQLPDWLRITGVEVPAHFATAITTHAVRSTTPSWEEFYGAATAYRQQHGDLRIALSYTAPGGLKLGEWLARQRVTESKGNLLPSRKERLDALGIAWAPKAEDWQRNYAAAQTYYQDHGHLLVPKGYVVLPGENGGAPVKLGDFVRALRAGLFHLDDDRLAALERIGMVWSVYDNSWQRHITAARAYREQHGNLLVPIAFTTDDNPPVALGQWVHVLRNSREQQSPDRIRELDDLGMVWSVHDYKWQRGFEAARNYYRTHGHLRVPAKYTTKGPDPVSLGRWVYKQRQNFRNNKLSRERALALTNIGMRW